VLAKSPSRAGNRALLSLTALYLMGCSVGNSSGVQSTPTASEDVYLGVYDKNGAALSDAAAGVTLTCRDTVVPALLCVVGLEDALNASIAFETNITDVTLPSRFADAHGLLVRALAHAARGFDLWIEALRDRDAAKLGDAHVELATASRLVHASFEAFPVDVRPAITEPLIG